MAKERMKRSDEEKIKIGKQIIELTEKGKTQEQISASVGIPTGSLSKIKKFYLESIEKDSIPKNLVDAFSEELNGKIEKVKVHVFPIKKTAVLNSITLYIDLDQSLEGDERELEIERLIREQLRYIEVSV